LVSAPYGGRYANTSSITMLSAIIRGRTTSCCSLPIRTFTVRELCNVARGWAGSCVITIKKRREMAGKSWMSSVGLVVELRLRNDNYDCWQMHKRIIAELRLRDRSVER
jgi:hypothetical protein